MIKVGSDFSGVGAFNQALMRLGIDYEEVFACDWNKYSRQTFALNYGEPTYFPMDVYEREIPQVSLDIYMTSPPCQAFSLAGKRKGEEDDRGVLFYNSHEFITKNKPRYFIFENVKGLLSDDGGKTFQRWIDFLGGKSVNGNPVIFPLEEATPYHVYYQVLNAKNYGIPQNRERIFIIGVRDDADNDFSFPKPFHLVKRLKDVLENEVDQKYFLSDKMLRYLISNSDLQKQNGNGFKFSPTDGNSIGKAVTTKAGQRMDDDFIQISKEVRTDESKLQRKLTGTNDFRGKKIEFIDSNVSNTITTSLTKDHYLKIRANTAKGYDTAEEEYEGIAVHPFSKKLEFTGFKDGNCPTLLATDYKAPKCVKFNTQRIRRLTPRECMRLMDFPETFKWDVSDSQAYKQAGNSICVGVLAQIISKLKL
jgi:DNA (cytosine-5)-methyltransferase 1